MTPLCYAIPGRVVSVEGQNVVVEYFGERKKARNDIFSLRPGDYVYAQGGFVIRVVPPKEAEEILAVWKETFFELQELDLRLSKMKLAEEGVQRKTFLLLDKVLEGRLLSKEELLYLFELRSFKERELLYKVANFLRRKYLGNSCCVHGILELSNFCYRNCLYCGISVHNRGLPRYRMTDEEILEAVSEATERFGFQALVLQSGEDPGFPLSRLVDLIWEIRKRHAVLIFVSFGEVGLEALSELYEAGAWGLLLRFETGNPSLYTRLHPGFSLASRLAHIEQARNIGYVVATGALLGLPRQTPSDIVDDILLARSLSPEMYSFGPFLPHPATPLGGYSSPSLEGVLNALAVIRLADPENARILVTTAFETLHPEARRLGLLAGANSLMLNVTPLQYRRSYAIYPGKAHEDESVEEQVCSTVELLLSLGRAPTDLGV
ncbi:MAG: radical SAM protein [Candidatus Caldatribacteriaceae bacterium]